MNLGAMMGAYAFPEGSSAAVPYGNGHINDTFLVSIQGEQDRYILQRINGYVFKKPEEVMENIHHVTRFLGEKITAEGGDPRRETLTLIPTRDGSHFVVDEEGSAWRCYLCVPDTVSPELPDAPEMLEECGLVFGLFSRRLLDFPAETLHETIAGFHNTPNRIRQLEEAARENAAGRLSAVAAEMSFAEERAKRTAGLLEKCRQGRLPTRVTHNDTKVNNVLLDRETGKAVCVVDLDTVMPGLLAYDFGDAIRVGASTAAEDERDLSLVRLDLDKAEAFARGYLAELGPVLGREELLSLAEGAWMMTFECGIRFLADHLNGDVYFKIHRENHNLDRARTQFTLAAEIERQMPKLEKMLLGLAAR